MPTDGVRSWQRNWSRENLTRLWHCQKAGSTSDKKRAWTRLFNFVWWVVTLNLQLVGQNFQKFNLVLSIDGKRENRFFFFYKKRWYFFISISFIMPEACLLRQLKSDDDLCWILINLFGAIYIVLCIHWFSCYGTERNVKWQAVGLWKKPWSVAWNHKQRGILKSFTAVL